MFVQFIPHPPLLPPKHSHWPFNYMFLSWTIIMFVQFIPHTPLLPPKHSHWRFNYMFLSWTIIMFVQFIPHPPLLPPKHSHWLFNFMFLLKMNLFIVTYFNAFWCFFPQQWTCHHNVLYCLFASSKRLSRLIHVDRLISQYFHLIYHM